MLLGVFRRICGGYGFLVEFGEMGKFCRGIFISMVCL